jgi:TPR repeat protein
LSATPPAAGACDFTLASCEASCAAGDGVSCYRLGRLLSSDYFGARNEPRAAQLFAAACAAGVGDACNAVAAGVRDDEHDGARAAALFEKACEMNSSKACLNGGTLRAHYPAFADVAKARAMYDRGCALDQPAAVDCCFELGGVLQASGDADGAQAAFTKACAQGDAGACTKLAALGGAPPLVTPDERARRAATNCDLGDGDACFGAAMALEKGTHGPRDLDGALRLYDKGCALQGLDACARLAFALGGLDPRAGFVADADKAARAAQSGCVLARNFHVPAALRLCKLFSAQQAPAAAAVDDGTRPGDLFYCEQNGNAESCANVGYRIANGQGRPVDPAKATTYLDRV